MEIKYPTFKIQSGPTPSDTLWICDSCGQSDWSWYNFPSPRICYCNKKHPRMRRASQEEQEEAKKYLKTVVNNGKVITYE